MRRIKIVRHVISIGIEEWLIGLALVYVGEASQPIWVIAQTIHIASIERWQAQVTQHVVKGAIFHHDHYNGFDFAQIQRHKENSRILFSTCLQLSFLFASAYVERLSMSLVAGQVYVKDSLLMPYSLSRNRTFCAIAAEWLSRR